MGRPASVLGRRLIRVKNFAEAVVDLPAALHLSRGWMGGELSKENEAEMAKIEGQIAG